MKNNLVEFDVIQNGIKGLRARAENGIKRITADFLVSNFFEDIEGLRKRGFSFEEIIDELHILLSETIPEKDERDKLFSIKSGTLKVYMSRQRKAMLEAATRVADAKKSRIKNGKKTEVGTSTPKETTITARSKTAQACNSGNIPTGRAKATDLDREI